MSDMTAQRVLEYMKNAMAVRSNRPKSDLGYAGEIRVGGSKQARDGEFR